MFKQILYLLFFLLLVGCTKPDARLVRAEQQIESSPDSAMQVLQQFASEKSPSESDQALYGMLLMRTLDKNLQPLQPDSLLNQTIQYYEIHPDGDHLATCYFLKGRSYKYALRYDKAMYYYMQALDDLGYFQNYSLLGRINYDLGEIYTLQKDFAAASSKFSAAYHFFSKGKLSSLAFQALLYISRTYNGINEYQKAKLFCKSIAPKACDSILKGTLLQEIGINCYKLQQLDSALIYFQLAIQYPYLRNNRALRYYFLANTFYDLEKYDSAQFYAEKAFLFQSDLRTQRECYRILTNTDYIKGDLTSMTSNMNKYVKLGDQLREIDAQAKGTIIETMHKSKLETLQSKYNLWVISVIFILIVVLSVYLFRKFYLFTKQKFKKTEADHLQQKVDIKHGVLTKKRETLHEKIAQRQKESATERKKANPEEREKLIQRMYNELLHLNDVSFFFQEMDAELNNIPTKLRTRYQGVGEKEIMWSCLLLLGIPTADILTLLSYKTVSLDKMKYRYAQKIGLESAKELKGFLNTLLSED
ncbi:MAG: hypothetical protein ACOYOT_04565 [Bacteroidales bacterium]